MYLKIQQPFITFAKFEQTSIKFLTFDQIIIIFTKFGSILITFLSFKQIFITVFNFKLTLTLFVKLMKCPSHLLNTLSRSFTHMCSLLTNFLLFISQ